MILFGEDNFALWGWGRMLSFSGKVMVVLNVTYAGGAELEERQMDLLL